MADKIISAYGANWPGNVCPLQIEMGCIQKGGSWTSKDGRKCGEGLPHHYEAMRKILWPHLDNHRWSSLARDEILRNKITVLMGCASCVAGDTVIEGTGRSVEYLFKNKIAPIVQTLEGPKQASIPFKKGTEMLYEVSLRSGNKFISTLGHRVLTDSGFVCVSDVRPGHLLLSYEPRQESNSGTDQQEFFQDALRLTKKAQDSQCDCPECLRSYGEQPPSGKAFFQCDSPSPIDAQECIFLMDFGTLDGPVNKRTHIRSYQQSCHPSSCNDYDSVSHLENCVSRRSPSEIFSHAFRSFRRLSPFQKGTIQICSSRKSTLNCGGKHCFCGVLSWGIFHPFSSERFGQSLSSSPSFLKPKEGLSRFSNINPEAFCSDEGSDCNNSLSCDFMVSHDAVLSITPIGTEDFYDLNVPDVHHYFAGGAIHHNSGKTSSAAWIYLTEYLCFPEETCVLVASTDIQGLRLRVWGEINTLWQQAKDQYEWLPGHLLDSKLLISTDSLTEDNYDERTVRDWRKGVKGVPCMQNSKFVGIAKFCGIKQKRMRLIADEAQMMGGSFLNAFANLDKNEDFRAIILGNPNDVLDPLGRAAEPLDGWTKHMEPSKTEVWKTRFMNGTCVNFVGTDSPNFDYPADQPTRYKYLISREKIANTLSFFSKDSVEYYSQCMGVMKIGQMLKRVITRDLCRQFRAHDDVVWKGTGTTKVYALDAAYGGDRCVGGWAEFGEDVTGKTILYVHKPNVIPILVGSSPEDQIAARIKNDCLGQGIQPENMGHDSTGRGSLGTAIARAWSAQTNPVEFGGNPTDRPVSLDLYVSDGNTHQKRLVTCKEHYSKFVTELWFSVRYAIEAGQIRGLTDDIIDEGCMREWRLKGAKKEVETKEEMKQRTGRSPDLFDWLSIIVEMARRKGFQIARLANAEYDTPQSEWLDPFIRKQKSLLKSGRLDYAA